MMKSRSYSTNESGAWKGCSVHCEPDREHTHAGLESAKLVGVDPAEYLRRAVAAAFAGEDVPLPHEFAATS
ncbi:hypothetical protein A7982_13318 [Minicystis rosea]|nr:hypothetical protein A7982_13318 [Minicystis rosea]